MNRIKELVLREFGDDGADTLEKYWAQIEYTAYWCISLLSNRAGLVSVAPEAVEDLVLEREECFELHQVKCRDESQPSWTTSEVLPILCKQYSRRRAFSRTCYFHFVSDHVADTKTRFQPGTSLGALSRLKFFLETEHAGQGLAPAESSEFGELEREIVKRISELMRENHSERVDNTLARQLLHNTWIDTRSIYVRSRPFYDGLAHVLLETFPGQPPCAMPHLEAIYRRILLMIATRIITKNTIAERSIRRADILSCRVEATRPEPGLPDLDSQPGTSAVDKKALYGGFDATELPAFGLQRIRADSKRRRLELLGRQEQIEDLSLALITDQQYCRRLVSKSSTGIPAGPDILEMMRSRIGTHIETYCRETTDVDEPFCLGLLWSATDECHLWWHRLGGM
jgi:hypothetical protein